MNLTNYTQTGVFFPDVIPYDLLGPVGRFLFYMNYSLTTFLKLTLAFAVVAHAGEGTYAYVLARYIYCPAFVCLSVSSSIWAFLCLFVFAFKAYESKWEGYFLLDSTDLSAGVLVTFSAEGQVQEMGGG